MKFTNLFILSTLLVLLTLASCKKEMEMTTARKPIPKRSRPIPNICKMEMTATNVDAINTNDDTIKLYQNIVLNLDKLGLGKNIEWNPLGGTISLRKSGTLEEPTCMWNSSYSCAYETTDSILNLSKNILTIYASINDYLDESKDYGHYINSWSGVGGRHNLISDQAYDIYSDNALLDDDRNPINGVIATIRTENITPEHFFVRLRPSSEYRGCTGAFDYTNSGLSSFHIGEIENGEAIHSLDGAVYRGITGAGIKIGLYDPTPVVTDSDDIQGAVVYSVTPDYNYESQRIVELLMNTHGTGTYYYTHSTQMVRYMLNYAPSVDIYQLAGHKFPESHGSSAFSTAKMNVLTDAEATEYLSYGESFKLADKLGLDIFSHSGGNPVTSTTLSTISDFVSGGGVISISIGNRLDIKNTLDDRNCRQNQKFIPYGIDWTDKKGVIVTLNSFTTLSEIVKNSEIEHFRSHAGDAKYYTLSIVETGVGATSQATATFSAIVALMLEANQTYGSGFSPRQLVELLFETAHDIGAVGVDDIYGYGAVNVEAALDRVQNHIPPTFVLYDDLPKRTIDWDDTRFCSL